MSGIPGGLAGNPGGSLGNTPGTATFPTEPFTSAKVALVQM